MGYVSKIKINNNTHDIVDRSIGFASEVNDHTLEYNFTRDGEGTPASIFVDEHYNPTSSTHAQSGTAVAEAIENMPITVVDGKICVTYQE